jgi:hypothetical protein
MRWDPERYVDWFGAYSQSSAATASVRRVATRHCFPELAEELRSKWIERLLTTMENYRREHRELEISSTSDATGYAYRALDHAAKDLLRSPERRERAVDPSGFLSTVVVDLRADAVEITETRDLVDRVRHHLNAKFLAGFRGTHSCQGRRCLAIALAAIEIASGVSPVQEVEEVQGGTDEWDRLVYAAIDLLYPEHHRDELGHRSAATRKMKSRCGNCAREVLWDAVNPISSATPEGVDSNE